MTEKQIKLSIETGRVQLSFWQKFNYYGAVGFFIILALFAPFFWIKSYIEGEFIEIDKFLLGISLFLFFLAFIVLVRKHRKLNFKIIQPNISKEEVNKILNDIANQFDWTFTLRNENIVIAESRTLLTRSGEMIVLIFNDNEVLINSIDSPNKRFTPASFGWNKINVNTIIERIQKANC